MADPTVEQIQVVAIEAWAERDVLKLQLNAARATNARLHRRVQEAESTAARVIRQNDPEQLWRTVAYLKRWAEREAIRTAYWQRLYREAGKPWWRRVASVLRRST